MIRLFLFLVLVGSLQAQTYFAAPMRSSGQLGAASSNLFQFNIQLGTNMVFVTNSDGSMVISGSAVPSSITNSSASTNGTVVGTFTNLAFVALGGAGVVLSNTSGNMTIFISAPSTNGFVTASVTNGLVGGTNSGVFYQLAGQSNSTWMAIAGPVTNYGASRVSGLLTTLTGITNVGGFTNGGLALFLGGVTNSSWSAVAGPVTNYGAGYVQGLAVLAGITNSSGITNGGYQLQLGASSNASFVNIAGPQTNYNTVYGVGGSFTGWLLTAITGQTNDLFQWRDTNSVPQARFDSNGIPYMSAAQLTNFPALLITNVGRASGNAFYGLVKASNNPVLIKSISEGSNVTMTDNGSNIVIAASASGAVQTPVAQDINYAGYNSTNLLGLGIGGVAEGTTKNPSTLIYGTNSSGQVVIFRLVNTNSLLRFDSSVNGAAYSGLIYFTSAGEVFANSTGSAVYGADLVATPTRYIYWTGRALMSSPADGILLFQNTAGTSFTRLQLGGTTATFPAFKRNAAGIDLVGGDGTYNATNNFSVPGNGFYTNGLASYSTATTNAVAASGYTNNTAPAINQTAYVTATAVSFTIKDRTQTTLYTSPTLTTTISIQLQPGWSVTAASGLTGTVLPW